MKMSRCPVCNGSQVATILTLEAMPVFSNVLHETRREALEAECTRMQLECCHQCGFIYNATFEPDRVQYNPDYENDLSASPRFCKYANILAHELVQRYDLNGKDIIEIGCGNGHFLKLICDIGDNRGLGFDPSHDPHRASADRRRGTVDIVADLYSSRYSDRCADMICCRHVLEHIHDPLAFLLELRETLDSWNDCVVYFEVPNAGHTFLHSAIWDILYEHCNYFTRESLQTLFLAAGFQPLQIEERYDGEFLTIEAEPASRAERRRENTVATFPDIANQLVDFQSSFYGTVAFWKKRITGWSQQHLRTVAWGAGAKGSTFFNVLGFFHDTVEYIVDIHPNKHGKFVPGTAQEIIPPASLAGFRPDRVIVMNPTYSKEIRQMAHEYVGDAKFIAASASHALSS